MDPHLHRAAINGSQDLAVKLNGVDSNRMVVNTMPHFEAKSGKLQISEGDDHDHDIIMCCFICPSKTRKGTLHFVL